MASARDITPQGLINLIAEPTRPIVIQVGETACRIKGSLHVPISPACEPQYWEDFLLSLENDGRFDSCSGLVVSLPDGKIRESILAAILDDTVCDAVLSLVLVHVLRAEDIINLHPLLLGDGDLPFVPARVVEASGEENGGGPGLFIGDKDAAANRAALDALGIRAIVNATRDIPNHFSREPEFTYLRLELDDEPDESILRHVGITNVFINQAFQRGDGVLVHCSFGVSRSASLVIAHLMCTRVLTYEEALDTLRQSRWSVRPNEGFRKQLIDLESRLRKGT